jgi:hypothetical protein
METTWLTFFNLCLFIGNPLIKQDMLIDRSIMDIDISGIYLPELLLLTFGQSPEP